MYRGGGEMRANLNNARTKGEILQTIPEKIIWELLSSLGEMGYPEHVKTDRSGF